MTVNLDLVTLVVQLDISADELSRMQANLRCAPEHHDPRATKLMTKILHERSHLMSFLGSDLAKVHRMILDIQLHQAQSAVWEISQSRLLDRVTVPILDRRDWLFPNAVGAYPKLKIEVAASIRREMDALSQFVMGYAPDCDRSHLLRAYKQLLKLSNVARHDELGMLLTRPPTIGSSLHDDSAICFMRDHHYAMTLPQMCNPPGHAASALPILPRIQAHGVPGSEAPIPLHSRSVLEGLAVIGELVGMRELDIRSSHAVRLALPVAYQSALVYCLDCINHVSGERYSLAHLLASRVPAWVHITMAAMLDLAVQIEAPESPIGNHAVLIEKCPAWRLLLIGACVKAQHAPLIKPGATFDCREIHDWLRLVCSILGWQAPKTRDTAISTSGHSWQTAPITGDSLFDHLLNAAAAHRDRDQLRYLTGQMNWKEGEWLDFTACETRDRQQVFLTDDHIQARRDFITIQGLQHYGISALVFGPHWDSWWLRRGVRRPSQHTPHIASGLNYAIRIHPQFGSLPDGRARAFLDDEISVREEFDEILGFEDVDGPTLCPESSSSSSEAYGE